MRITPEKKYPFNILESSTINANNISVKIEKAGDKNPAEYILTVRNISKVKGKYFDSVMIRTDNNVHPYIKIPVLGNIF